MIRILPVFDAYYYSFYIEGLRQIFGRQNLGYYADSKWPLVPHSLCFEVDGKRIYISAEDGSGFNSDALQWCDVYAKVNIDPNVQPEDHRKVLPIGPSFAINNDGFSQTLMNMVHTTAMITSSYDNLRQRLGKKYWPREHLANHWRQYKHRLPLSVYQPGKSQRDYVFFVGSVWKREAQTNSYRATFMDICRGTPGLRFEGGFPPRDDGYTPYEHLLMSHRVPFTQYIEKLKKSALVFNTPAVHGCLGWKLGEFLALGKAIISTDIGRMLPAPFVHQKNIHFIDGSEESMREAINRITSDDAYRAKLEAGAREYYDTYLAPGRVIERIMNAVSTGVVVS
jgi:glycosyltransferase involved in cell wall biosynthesis